MKIQEDFYKLHKFVTLTSGFMFVSGNAFMITSSKKLKFLTFDHISSQTADHLSKILNKVIKLYGRGGFIVVVILMYM